MSDVHRIFGFELSPYSVKVRSYFRYKGIPHEWVLRGPATEPEYQKYAKIPIVPLVVTPGDEGLQDSTPILDRLEAEHPDPSVHPEDPTVGFLSASATCACSFCACCDSFAHRAAFRLRRRRSFQIRFLASLSCLNVCPN